MGSRILTRVAAGSCGLVLLVGSALLAGCSDPSTSPSTHADGKGPLSATSSPGGQAAARPQGSAGGDPWWVTFGGLVLCSTAEDTPIHIDRVRFKAAPAPLETRVLYRSIPATAERTGPNDAWNLVSMSLGTHETLGLGGAFSADAPVIEDGCDDLQSSDYALPYVELITEAKSGAAGVDLRKMLIDYHADGRAYTLDIPWENMACGTEIDADWCPET